MQSRDFCYWLQGFFEITAASSNRPPEGLTQGQADMIQRHLALVFQHEIDPAMGDKEHQDKLNTTHFGKIGPDGMVYRC